MADPNPPSSNPPFQEQAAWSQIEGTWQPLHGSFFDSGLSIEWHNFRVEREMDWGRSFHPGSLEICLNYAGTGILQDGDLDINLGPDKIAIYILHKERIRALRHANTAHRFFTLEISPSFLQKHFANQLNLLKPTIRNFVTEQAKTPPWLEILPLPASLLALRVQFVEPPVPQPAQETWYLGRVLEILSLTLFPQEDPDELYSQKHQRTNREYAERARFLIERDLENPPSLDMLAIEIGCSKFNLSRIFAQETGASIPKFLRMKRIEKAAELIRTGKMNVSQAAFTVGYSSLSAFNRAFVEQMGCFPGLYPDIKIEGRSRL